VPRLTLGKAGASLRAAPAGKNRQLHEIF
jgi:hypothetical protein